MSESIVYLAGAFLGVVAGMGSRRLPASGSIALALPLFALAVFCSLIGRS